MHVLERKVHLVRDDGCPAGGGATHDSVARYTKALPCLDAHHPQSIRVGVVWCLNSTPNHLNTWIEWIHGYPNKVYGVSNFWYM